MAGPRASSGLLRSRIRRQSSSLTPPSASPTTTGPSGPAPKVVRLESLAEEQVQFPGAEACVARGAEQVQRR